MDEIKLTPKDYEIINITKTYNLITFHRYGKMLTCYPHIGSFTYLHWRKKDTLHPRLIMAHIDYPIG